MGGCNGKPEGNAVMAEPKATVKSIEVISPKIATGNDTMEAQTTPSEITAAGELPGASTSQQLSAELLERDWQVQHCAASGVPLVAAVPEPAGLA